MSEVKKPGYMKQLGIGCLILLAILLVGGVIIFFQFRSSIKAAGGYEAWKNKKSAEFIDYVVKQSMAPLPLNELEKASINQVADKVSARIQKGEIDVVKCTELVNAGYRSILPEVFIALTFQQRHLKPDNVAGIMAVNRFANGMLQGKIDIEAAWPFISIAVVNPEAVRKLHNVEKVAGKDPASEIKFHENMPAGEIAKAIAAMQEAADKAGMPNTRTDLNFAPLLEKLIHQNIPEKVAAADLKK